MNWKNLGWGFAATLVCIHAVAVDFSFTPNPAEMTRMPPYCQAKFTLKQGSPEWNAWRDRIGSNFIDLHHYCAGLNFANRYWSATNSKDRGFYLQNAMNNFNYMVRAAKPDFVLGAQLYSDRGEVFKLMGKRGEAAKDFDQAISINPRIVKPYLQLADLYVADKSAKRALETVTEGLRHIPDSTALQRRYLELGGRKPFPDPIVAKVGEAQPEAPASNPQAAAGESKQEPVAQTASPPAIGTTSNPYCRFCPPE
jgi:tetratricopeptide (TPR) repeat protein